MGYSPWDIKESDMTEHAHTHTHTHNQGKACLVSLVLMVCLERQRIRVTSHRLHKLFLLLSASSLS